MVCVSIVVLGLIMKPSSWLIVMRPSATPLHVTHASSVSTAKNHFTKLSIGKNSANKCLSLSD